MIPVAWLGAPFFGPVSAVTSTFLPRVTTGTMHTSTSALFSTMRMFSGSMLNSGTV